MPPRPTIRYSRSPAASTHSRTRDDEPFTSLPLSPLSVRLSSPLAPRCRPVTEPEEPTGAGSANARPTPGHRGNSHIVRTQFRFPVEDHQLIDTLQTRGLRQGLRLTKNQIVRASRGALYAPGGCRAASFTEDKASSSPMSASSTPWLRLPLTPARPLRSAQRPMRLVPCGYRTSPSTPNRSPPDPACGWRVGSAWLHTRSKTMASCSSPRLSWLTLFSDAYRPPQPRRPPAPPEAHHLPPAPGPSTQVRKTGCFEANSASEKTGAGTDVSSDWSCRFPIRSLRYRL